MTPRRPTPAPAAPVVGAAVAAALLLGGCADLDRALDVGDPGGLASVEAAGQTARLGDVWPPVSSPAQVSLTVRPDDPATGLRAVVLAPEGRCGLGEDGFRLDTGTPDQSVDRLGRLGHAELAAAGPVVPGTPAPATLTASYTGQPEALGEDGVLTLDGELLLDPDGATATFTGSQDALRAEVTLRCAPPSTASP